MGNDCCKDDKQERYRPDEQRKVNAEIEKLRNRHGEETETLKRQLHEYEQDKARYQKNVSSMNKQLKNVMGENESLKTRLSAAIGARVRDGNPNIADLSDMNRPINLSNDYSELYDNKWTDAYDDITKIVNMSERDACRLLCDIFCEIYKVCIKKADEELGQLKSVMLAFYGTDDTEIRKQFKDKRKEQHDHGKKNMEKEIMVKVSKVVRLQALMKSDILAAYIDECLRIAWLMSIQDPPVFVDTNMSREGEKFDTNVFKAYTKSGTEIDFIVWPAVYLAKGEGLLAKGVAQGRRQVTPQHQTPPSPGKSFDKAKGQSERNNTLNTTNGQHTSPINQDLPHTKAEGQKINDVIQPQMPGNPNNPGDSHVPTKANSPTNHVKNQMQEKSQQRDPAKKTREPPDAKPSTPAGQKQHIMNPPPKTSEQQRMSNTTRGQTNSAPKQQRKTKYEEWVNTAPQQQSREVTHPHKTQAVQPPGKQSVKTVLQDSHKTQAVQPPGKQSVKTVLQDSHKTQAVQPPGKQSVKTVLQDSHKTQAVQPPGKQSVKTVLQDSHKTQAVQPPGKQSVKTVLQVGQNSKT